MTNTILVNNVHSQLLTNDPDLKIRLWSILRFKDRGCFHKAAYKMKVWDGFVDFFKKENGKFLTGLLPEVTTALNYWNIPYQLEDQRLPFHFKYDKIDKNFIPGFILRYFQVDFINQALKYKRGVIDSPTGSGKSLSQAGIIKCLPDNAVCLVLCPTIDLVNNNYNEIISSGFKDVGRIGDKYNDPHRITCMTYHSWHKYKKLSKHVQVLIVDEIHDMMNDSCRKIYRELPNAIMRIALSATPMKFGGEDNKQKYEVKGYFGPPFICETLGRRLTIKDLQDDGTLSQNNITFFKYKGPELPPYLLYTDAVTLGISENDDFHNVIANLALSLSGRTLILVERIKQGDALKEKLGNAIWVSGKDDGETRQEVIEKLKYDQNTIGIATSKIFSTGVNVFIHNLINAAGGQADHTVKQKLGRGLRKAEDKGDLNYFDILFENNEYLKKHSKKRIKILESEGHTVDIKSEEELRKRM